MTETRKAPRTTRVKNEWASDGAVSQAGPLPLYACTTCGDEVVWVTSRRTGRPYLCNVRKGYKGQRFYQGNDVHPRDCADQKADRVAEYAADEARREANHQFGEQLSKMQRKHRSGEITTEELVAWMDEQTR